MDFDFLKPRTLSMRQGEVLRSQKTPERSGWIIPILNCFSYMPIFHLFFTIGTKKQPSIIILDKVFMQKKNALASC